MTSPLFPCCRHCEHMTLGGSFSHLAPCNECEQTAIAQPSQIAGERETPLYVHCGCDQHGDHGGCWHVCDMTGCTQQTIETPAP